MKRVTAGRLYRFVPVMLDVTDPPFGVSPGDVVTPIKLPGCPRIGTMGMCHVAKDGRFAGLVCLNSLQPIGGEKK